MKIQFNFYIYTLPFLSILLAMQACNHQNQEDLNDMPKPPVAEKIEKTLTAHNEPRTDNYYWMKLSEEQKSAENPDEQTTKVLDYLNAENTYTAFVMKHTEDLQDKLYNEIVGRIKQTDESVPYFSNGYWYYQRYEEGLEYPIYSRKKGSMEAEEEVMINVNDLASEHEYYQIGGLSVSKDNRLLAYSADTVSRRRYTIYFKNLETGETLTSNIPNTTGSCTWANDNKTVFYSRKDEQTLRSDRIMKHKLGTNADNDVEIYKEKDDTFYTGVYKTKSDKYIIIWSGSTLTNHYQILPADTPDKEFKEFSPRERELEYSIEHFEDKFYIITNLDAVNFRLMETPENNTEKKNWKEVIAHRKDVYLESMEVFKNYLVLDERANALTNLRIINQNTKEEHYLDFGEEAYMAYISINPEFDTELLRYGYTSLTTPNSTFDYNMKTKEKTLLKQQEVVGGYNPEDYHTERKFATTSDGVKVPISLVYKKALKQDTGNPLLLYGYGSYGHTIDPSFSSVRLSLLDRGFVFAIAHVRGGEAMGRPWYEDGKMFNKKNTFTDFIACGEALIKEGYTSKEHLYAMGGSAGGLLMGAIVNMRPGLFNGIIAAVPFVDVITTMLDDSIPLTTGEYDEWGNPNEKASYDYMLSYSPYDNVTKQDYPNMLVTTGLHDSQVQYWEPAKWVAKLREIKTDNNRLLLHTNMETGHSGASGRFKQHKETALDYAFLLDLESISE